MAEITHTKDTDESGRNYMRQVVSPKRLREILRKDGDALDRPKDFGPLDEWDVGDDEPRD